MLAPSVFALTRYATAQPIGPKLPVVELGESPPPDFVYDTTFAEALQRVEPGGTIRLRPGLYRLRKTLRVPNGVSIIGSGRPTQIIAQFAESQPVMEFLPQVNVNGVRVADFHIRSDRIDNQGIRAVPSDALIMRRHHEFELRGISVEGPSGTPFTGQAFRLEGCFSGAIYGCSAIRCDGALELGRPPDGREGSNNVTVVSMASSGMTTFGGRILGSHSVQLIGCEFNVAEAESGTDTGKGMYGLIVNKSVTGPPARAQSVSVVGGLYAATRYPILVGDDLEYPVNGLSVTGAMVTGLASRSALHCVRLVNVNGAFIQGNVFQHYNGPDPIRIDPKCTEISIGGNFKIQKPPY